MHTWIWTKKNIQVHEKVEITRENSRHSKHRQNTERRPQHLSLFITHLSSLHESKSHLVIDAFDRELVNAHGQFAEIQRLFDQKGALGTLGRLAALVAEPKHGDHARGVVLQLVA